MACLVFTKDRNVTSLGQRGVCPGGPWYLAQHRTLEKGAQQSLAEQFMPASSQGGSCARLPPAYHTRKVFCNTHPHPIPESHGWLAAVHFDENRELQSHRSLQAVRKHQGSNREPSRSVCQQNCYCLPTSISFLRNS